MKQTIVISLFLLLGLTLRSQTATISPQVINAAGNHRQAGSTQFWITDNIGEPFTESVNNNALGMMITEGFLQPELVSVELFTLEPAVVNQTQCKDKEDDAFIKVSVATKVKPDNYTLQYFWTPSSVCPSNDCDKIDTLKPGPYSVMIAITYTTNVGVVRHDTLRGDYTINPALTPCNVKVFSGVTPNNDKVNDFFDVENIKEYPNSHVTIFNRWGNQLADITGYNTEVSGKRWPEDDDLSKLTSTTYFYIVELGDGSAPMKGWIELIKN